MGAFFEEIPESLIKWILEQKMFWVATAPLSGKGHVNVSPKGGQYFGVLDHKTFWYQELTGSGNETISHLYEPGNNRITVMFNAFDGPPRIMRMFGRGRVYEHSTPDFNEFVAKHNVDCIPGTRSIIIVDIHQVGTSCGFSVPYYDFKDYRPILNDFFKKKAKKEAEGVETESMPRYWALKNSYSMDGLPGTNYAQRSMKEYGIKPLKKMVGPLAPTEYKLSGAGYRLEHLLLAAILSALLTAMVLSYGGEIMQTLETALPIEARRALTSPLATLR